jgi:peptidylprolyl isomerase
LADLSAKPVRHFSGPPSFTLNPKDDYLAVMVTNRGPVLLYLYSHRVPNTVNSFVWLARHRFYDGLLFHRVIPGFVVQGGDPNTLSSDRNTWGLGGPGYTIDLELRRRLNFDRPGVLGMARSQSPNSGGSQFFITLAPTPNLDGQYTVFGKVLRGMSVVNKIKPYQAPAPGTPDRILRLYIAVKPVGS